jgi:hypothetical protein
MIERDLAQTRARMDARLDDLQERLSPGRVLDELVTYFRGSEGAEFGRNLMASVQENPLPAALTGIGLTWLMASSTAVRTAPPPGPTAQTARTPAERREAKERHEDLELRVLTAGGEVYRQPDESEDDHRARVDEARGKVLGLKREAEDTAESFGKRISDALENAKQAATEKLHDLRDSAADTMDRVKERVTPGNNGQGTGSQGTDGLVSALTGNPVALGAMGLMLGAVLGALVPQSEAEEAALGGLAGQARKAAADLAQQAADKGGEIAQKVVDASLESAQDHGLTGDKPVSELFRDATSGDLVDNVKQVAQDAMKAGDQAVREGGIAGEGSAGQGETGQGSGGAPAQG